MSEEMEDYQTLTRCQKVKKIMPKILPILLLSVILPTADVGTDLALIIKLYKGVAACFKPGERKENIQFQSQNETTYRSDPANNQNVCDVAGSHPKTASSLLFFFLLNYVIGLVTCIRLEGRKWAPLISALFDVYPQYCKILISNFYNNFVHNTNVL